MPSTNVVYYTCARYLGALMELGDMLQKIREGKGLTQAQLAKKAGVSLRTIQSWEQGHRSPISPDFFLVVKALGVSADDFAGTTSRRRVSKAHSKRKGK